MKARQSSAYVKRVVDLCLASFALPFLALATIIVGIAIVLESKGSPIFKQERVGQHGKLFTLYKFRTMHRATEHRPTHETDTTAVTRVGALLRRTKLDELPQLWNVLTGDMSLVGPRPCLPTQHVLIDERRERGVLNLRPGITGPAQLARLDMSQPIALATVDAQYKELSSFLYDARCILSTARGRGSGDPVQSPDRMA